MEHLEQKQKITIMIAIMSAMFFAAVNQTIVGNALPTIISDLGGMDYYSWVFTIYMLTSSITTILVGKLSDIYGRKPFLLIGIIIFMIGAFLTGTSQNISQIITYRGIQGLGGGMIMSTAITSVGDLFSPRERGKWQGAMAGVFGLASVFGPTLGGYIVDHFEWKWVFWVFLPLGLVAFVLIMRLFPSVEKKAGESVDYIGSFFLTTTIVPMLLAFSWAGTKYDWGSSQTFSLFGAAIVSLIIFIMVERKVKTPIIPLYLFKNSIFTLSNIIGFSISIAMFGSSMYVPYYVQGVLGFTPTHSSFITMSMTLGLVVASAIGGQIITRTGKYKIQALVGLTLTTIGMFMLSTMDQNTGQFQLVSYLVLVGFGLGVGNTVFTLTVQNAVDQKLLGVATANSQLFRSLGGTVGVAVMGTLLNSRMADKMGDLAKTNTAPVPPEMKDQAKAFMNPQILLDHTKLHAIQGKLPAEMQDYFSSMVHTLQSALSSALSGVFFLAACVVIFAMFLALFLKEIPLRGTYNAKVKKEKTSQKESLKVQSTSK